jgi:phage-related protein
MATTVAQLKAVLSADTRDFDRAMGRSQTKTQRFGMVAKSALVGGVAGGFYLLAKAAKIGWGEYNKGQQVAAQTNAVIKSTGGVANVTAAHVEALGGTLMRLSGIDDEVIKSGENILLTFRGIRNEMGKGNDIFDQATKATLDLSVAMHKDLNSSAVLVGKALQDPIRGLTALRRVGVQLTLAQEATIKKMVESGNVMGAQKIILGELRKEFEGSAAAVGKTFGGQLNILRERLNNFLGVVVGKAIPVLQSLAVRVLPRVDAAIAQASAFIVQLRQGYDQMAAVFQRHQTTLNAVVRGIRLIAAAIQLVTTLQRFWLGVTITVWTGILRAVLPVTDKVIGAIQKIVGWIRTLIGWIRSIPDINLHINLPSIPHIPGLSHIPGFQHGGIVPGPLNAPRLILAHGGERVVPVGGGGGTVVFNFPNYLGDKRELISELRNAVREIERRNGRPAF